MTLSLKQYRDTILVSESGKDKGREFRLRHASLGIKTEASELLDIVKKGLVYGKKIDRVNLVEELGDVCWYLVLAIDADGINPDDVRPVKIEGAPALYGEDLLEAIECGADMLLGCAFALDSLRRREVTARGQSVRANAIGTVNVIYTVIERLAIAAGTGGQMISTGHMGTVLQANVDKLSKRYAGLKFTKDAALNRDLASETAAVSAAMGQGS